MVAVTGADGAERFLYGGGRFTAAPALLPKGGHGCCKAAVRARFPFFFAARL